MVNYGIGDIGRLQAAFQDVDNAYADPSSIKFKLKKPNGSIIVYVYGTDPQIVKSALGVYYVDYFVTEHGRYFYRYEGTGLVFAAAEESFNVKKSNF